MTKATEETRGTPFKSKKHPKLPPDRLQLNLSAPRSGRAALVLAFDYREQSPEFSEAVTQRVVELHPKVAEQGQAIGAFLDALDGDGAEIPKPLPAMPANKVMAHVLDVMEHLSNDEVRRILLAAAQFYGIEMEAT